MKKGGERKMEQVEEKVYKETCIKCGKVFRSLNEKELKHNFAVHQMSCEGNE